MTNIVNIFFAFKKNNLGCFLKQSSSVNFLSINSQVSTSYWCTTLCTKYNSEPCTVSTLYNGVHIYCVYTVQKCTLYTMCGSVL